MNKNDIRTIISVGEYSRVHSTQTICGAYMRRHASHAIYVTHKSVCIACDMQFMGFFTLKSLCMFCYELLSSYDMLLSAYDMLLSSYDMLGNLSS